MNHFWLLGILLLVVAVGALTAVFAAPRPAPTASVALTENSSNPTTNGPLDEPLADEAPLAAALSNETDQRVISITNGVKHGLPLEEILGGEPPPDGIPSIDDPKFVNVDEAGTYLNDDSPGLAVSLNGLDRFYPYQILVWHEIVNDTFADQRVLITYCPLCFSGVVYDPLVNGQRVEFGTSGKLWQSNLVMYDRLTQSYWSQVLGEAIRGDLTGTKLATVPSDITRFGLWKTAYPQGQVLSIETGTNRDYQNDPYGDYYTTPGTYFPVASENDTRLDQKELILGLVIDGQAKAYWPPAIKKAGEITDEFNGQTIIARYEPTLDAVRLFSKQPDGTLTRLNPLAGFWFSWVAAHPQSALYK